MFKHFKIYILGQSYFFMDNIFFKNSLFDLIFSYKSHEESQC